MIVFFFKTLNRECSWKLVLNGNIVMSNTQKVGSDIKTLKCFPWEKIVSVKKSEYYVT